jgi:hypothetical protein
MAKKRKKSTEKSRKTQEYLLKAKRNHLKWPKIMA